MTFKTTSIDLAASLLSAGNILADVTTQDGVIVAFHFPDHFGEGYEYSTEVAARAYEAGSLQVDALTLCHRLRDLRVSIRRAQTQYRRVARDEAGIQ